MFSFLFFLKKTIINNKHLIFLKDYLVCYSPNKKTTDHMGTGCTTNESRIQFYNPNQICLMNNLFNYTGCNLSFQIKPKLA